MTQPTKTDSGGFSLPAVTPKADATIAATGTIPPLPTVPIVPQNPRKINASKSAPSTPRAGLMIDVKKSDPLSEPVQKPTTNQKPTINGSVEVVSKNGKEIYKYEGTFKFLGRECKLMLYKPVQKNDPNDKENFDIAISDLIKVSLKKVEESGRIKKGQSFNIAYTDKGLIAYVPNKDKPFDFNKGNLREYLAEQEIPPLELNDDQAKEVSQIMHVESSGAIRDRLVRSQHLEKYLPLTTLKPSTKPTGLPNIAGSCALNAAIQVLSHPSILEELLSKMPDKTSKLYQILKMYKFGIAPPVEELHELWLEDLKLDNEYQDSHEVIRKILELADLDETSTLFCRTTKQYGLKDPSSGSIQWFPGLDGANGGILSQKQLVIQNSCDFDTLYNTTEELELSRAVEVLDGNNVKILPLPPKNEKQLAKDVYDSQSKFEFLLINRTRAYDKATKKVTKDPREVTSIPLKKNDGKQLIGFTVHTCDADGKGNHYYTFTRRGDTFWKADDGTITEQSSAQFLDAAKNASVLIYAKEEATAPATTTAPATEPKVEPKASAVANEIVEPKKSIGGRGFYLTIESGKLTEAGPGFAIVNPTDSVLTQKSNLANKQIFDALTGLEHQIEKHKKAIIDDRWSLPFRNKSSVSFDNGDVVRIDTDNKVVLNVVLPKKPLLDQSDIRLAVKASLEKARLLNKTSDGKKAETIRKVALPLITNEYNNAADIYNWMQLAIQKYVNDNSDVVEHVTEIKIILTPEQRAVIFPQPVATQQPVADAPKNAAPTEPAVAPTVEEQAAQAELAKQQEAKKQLAQQAEAAAAAQQAAEQERVKQEEAAKAAAELARKQAIATASPVIDQWINEIRSSSGRHLNINFGTRLSAGPETYSIDLTKMKSTPLEEPVSPTLETHSISSEDALNIFLDKLLQSSDNDRIRTRLSEHTIRLILPAAATPAQLDKIKEVQKLFGVKDANLAPPPAAVTPGPFVAPVLPGLMPAWNGPKS